MNFETRSIQLSAANELAAIESFLRSMRLIDDNEIVTGRSFDFGSEPNEIYIKKEVSE